jgi:Mn-dependent DtxR family transcriptional regulator
MKIQEAAQNYLETILVINNRQGHVRAIDICNELSYSKPTVSIVMKHFRENGYIITDSEGYITLTDKGRIIAESMYERHNVIAHILIGIGVDEDTAFRDACKIEHDISQKSFECMKKYFMTDKPDL